jgi:hypothetical protein
MTGRPFAELFVAEKQLGFADFVDVVAVASA